MVLGEARFGVYECRNCGAFEYGREESTCCDRPMEHVDADAPGVDPPDLEGLLGSVFGMSPTELRVCLRVMDAGEATTADLADSVGLDRSVVSRHLSHLVDLGVLERRRLVRKQGGHVYVYTPATLEEIKRGFEVGLYAWMGEAVDLIEGLSREKIEALTDDTGDADEWRIYAED